MFGEFEDQNPEVPELCNRIPDVVVCLHGIAVKLHVTTAGPAIVLRLTGHDGEHPEGSPEYRGDNSLVHDYMLSVEHSEAIREQLQVGIEALETFQQDPFVRLLALLTTVTSDDPGMN